MSECIYLKNSKILQKVEYTDQQENLDQLKQDLLSIQDIQNTFMKLVLDQDDNLNILDDKVNKSSIDARLTQKDLENTHTMTQKYRKTITKATISAIIGGAIGGGIGSAISLSGLFVGGTFGLGSGLILSLV